MSYKKRIQQRRLHNTLWALIEILSFKSSHLSLPKKIICIWNVLWIISLFLPWIQNNTNGESFHSFTSLSGNIWFLLIFVFIISFFTVFSHKYKQRLKLYSSLSFKNHFIILTSAIFVVSFSIIALSFINGLQTYIENLVYGQWIVLCLTSWIIILIGGYYMRKEFYSKNSEIILNQMYSETQSTTPDDNMKLPF